MALRALGHIPWVAYLFLDRLLAGRWDVRLRKVAAGDAGHHRLRRAAHVLLARAEEVDAKGEEAEDVEHGSGRRHEAHHVDEVRRALERLEPQADAAGEDADEREEDVARERDDDREADENDRVFGRRLRAAAAHGGAGDALLVREINAAADLEEEEHADED